MLLTTNELELLEIDGEETYKARKGLSDKELLRVIRLDKGYYDFLGKHIISNIQEVKAEHIENLKARRK